MKQFWNRVQEIKPWRKRPFYLSFAVFCVLMLLLILRLALPCGEELYEGSYSFPGGTATDHVAVYEGLSLSPGVYRVELAYETDQDLATHCNVADSSVLEGALLCNGEHFYSKLGKTGFLMWLFEGTEDLQVVVSYNGQGSLTTGDLTITETKLLWTMLLVILLFLAGLFFAGMIFFYYDKAYPVAAEKSMYFSVSRLSASLPPSPTSAGMCTPVPT